MLREEYAHNNLSIRLQPLFQGLFECLYNHSHPLRRQGEAICRVRLKNAEEAVAHVQAFIFPQVI